MSTVYRVFHAPRRLVRVEHRAIFRKIHMWGVVVWGMMTYHM